MLLVLFFKVLLMFQIWTCHYHDFCIVIFSVYFSSLIAEIGEHQVVLFIGFNCVLNMVIIDVVNLSLT